MTVEHLPEPLTPSEADLKDFPYTPIFRARLFGSAFHARANDAEWRAGITLWLKAQDQRPAGSLPDDDVELCRLAELGRDIRGWKRMREGALHGWLKCSDGRLYNQVVAEVVNAQWQEKIDQRSRTMKARIAALEKRLKDAKEQSVKDEIATQLQKLQQDLSQVIETAKRRAVTLPVTSSVTEAKRREEKEREGNKERENPNPTLSLDTARPSLAADAAPWVRIIRAFDEARDAAFPDQPRAYPAQNDRTFAEKFAEIGADLELCRSVFDATCRRFKAENRQPPSGLVYFKQVIPDAVKAKNTPLPAGQARGRSNGQMSIATPSKTEADEVERINAQFIAGGTYQSDISLSQVRAMIGKGLLTPEQARKAGYAA